MIDETSSKVGTAREISSLDHISTCIYPPERIDPSRAAGLVLSGCSCAVFTVLLTLFGFQRGGLA